AAQAWAPAAAKLLRRGDHRERQHHRRRRQALLLPVVRRRGFAGWPLGNDRDFQVLPALFASVHLARVGRELDVALGLAKGLLAGRVLGLKARHPPAMPLDHLPHGFGAEVHPQHLLHMHAGGRERRLRSQAAAMLLDRARGTLAGDAQQRIGRVRAVAAARALPVAAPEGDFADGRHQPTLLGPAVFLAAAASAAAERRPFFSATSTRRATASLRTRCWKRRPCSTTAISQAAKTAPSGAVNAKCSISSASANACRTRPSCRASTSMVTLGFMGRPCLEERNSDALVYPIRATTTREVGYTRGTPPAALTLTFLHTAAMRTFLTTSDKRAGQGASHAGQSTASAGGDGAGCSDPRARGAACPGTGNGDAACPDTPDAPDFDRGRAAAVPGPSPADAASPGSRSSRRSRARRLGAGWPAVAGAGPVPQHRAGRHPPRPPRPSGQRHAAAAERGHRDPA